MREIVKLTHGGCCRQESRITQDYPPDEFHEEWNDRVKRIRTTAVSWQWVTFMGRGVRKRQTGRNVEMRCLLLIAASLLLTGSARAQFTASFQTNTISGVSSNWSDDYYVGGTLTAYVSDSLQIVNSGVLTNYAGHIGNQIGAGSNGVVVAGAGSVWFNNGTLYVGGEGGSGQLVVTNAGHVTSVGIYVAYNSSSSNNAVLVSGSDSVYTNASELFFGYGGGANSLTITNGGRFYNSYGFVGNNMSSTSNHIVVTGTNSMWISSANLELGEGGGANSLLVADGAQVSCGGAGYIGYFSSSSNNAVLVTGSNSIWKAAGTLLVGYQSAGNSLIISNAGAVSCGGLFEGNDIAASNNSVLVTGTSSVLSNRSVVVIGYGNRAQNCSLTISNGAKIYGTAVQCGSGGDKSKAVITGTGSVWSNTGAVAIGSFSPANTMTITDGGALVSNGGIIGDQPSSANNMLTIIGSGSVWSNAGGIVVGQNGPSNSLVIAGGGRAFSAWGVAGGSGSSNNSVLVIGLGSLWKNTGTVTIGATSSGNNLVISNGGMVICAANYSGCGNIGGTNNTARVVDGGVWQTSGSIYIGGPQTGYTGSGNSLLVDGGTVVASNLFVGCGNLIQVDNGNVLVPTASLPAVLEIAGTFILNSGRVQVDELVVTNPCALLIRNGGMLSATTTNLDPNMSAVGDGIPNGWKLQHGLDPFNPDLANQEYRRRWDEQLARVSCWH